MDDVRPNLKVFIGDPLWDFRQREEIYTNKSMISPWNNSRFDGGFAKYKATIVFSAFVFCGWWIFSFVNALGKRNGSWKCYTATSVRTRSCLWRGVSFWGWHQQRSKSLRDVVWKTSNHFESL